MLTAALMAASAVLVGAPSARAVEPDRTGPRLDVSAAPAFVVGQNFEDPVDLDGDLLFFNGGGTFEYTWTASDPSGICRYSVDEEDGEEGWSDGVVDQRTTKTSGRTSFYADGYPTSTDVSAVRINAYDCAGNATSVRRPGAFPSVVVDYGAALASGWERTSCACAMGDTMLRTRTRGAALSTVVNAHGRSQNVALVMAEGPRRGKAAVFLDGRLLTTVDTFATSNSNRVIVWQTTITGTADHTIRVENLATHNRTRIDVDAILGASPTS